MQEIWKDIKGYEGHYKISNLGNIKNCETNILKRQYTDTDGYLVVNFPKKQFKVHRLVAQAFIINYYNKPQVNHIDGNKKNNNSNNLEWVTNLENHHHARKIGLIHDEKKIQQYDLNNKLIKVWNSQKEASNALKIPQGDISKCCNQKLKRAGNYRWKFLKEGV